MTQSKCIANRRDRTLTIRGRFGPSDKGCIDAGFVALALEAVGPGPIRIDLDRLVTAVQRGSSRRFTALYPPPTESRSRNVVLPHTNRHVGASFY